MRRFLLLFLLALSLASAARPRVVVSTDIGGTDPDDFQSMVHLLLYADRLDLEGLISSPYGPGRREHILEVIAEYEKDYPALTTHSATYPTPAHLRSISKQGALSSPGHLGYGTPTDGSRWLIECARRPDPRPLHVLIWGGIEDLAQALHDAPDILPKLRVYFIGGPNKMWSVDAYNYIEQHHPTLHIIESNSTYRGWFTGGDQDGVWSNTAFVAAHIAHRGALGTYFATHLKGTIKMGDTPSLVWLLNPDWSGQYIPLWPNRKTVFTSLTTSPTQTAEAFGVVEWSIPLPTGMSRTHNARLLIDNRIPAIAHNDGKHLLFRFSPRDAKLWPYVVESDFPALNGLRGSFTATHPATNPPDPTHPNWFADDPSPDNREGVHHGAKHINRWRHQFLSDFAQVFLRTTPASTRPRVLVLTDIENEPDDTQSLVRFLTYSNQFDIEGLVATTSVHQRERTASARIRELVNAYGQVRDNLALHEPNYPTAAHLLSLIRDGRPAFGMAAVGDNMDSPGSDLIITALAKPDPRPLWVLVWGGPNCLAQALHKLRATGQENLIPKLRVYTISDQDDSGPWLRRTFPGLFYIASPGFHAPGGYHFATWSGISGDNFHGRFTGPDFSIVDNPWLDTNVRAKGPLGALYPQTKFLMEGDTPSFLYLIPNGLSAPEHPNWGSWGGRYDFYTPPYLKHHYAPELRPLWADATDEVEGKDSHWHSSNKATIWRWREAYQNDFAARMDWTIKPYNQANHPPQPALTHPDHIEATAGQTITLDATPSKDPDGNTLTYSWTYYPEPSTAFISTARTPAAITIDNASSPKATVTIPKLTRPSDIHLILAVTDTGSPRLTRYRRIIIHVNP